MNRCDRLGLDAERGVDNHAPQECVAHAVRVARRGRGDLVGGARGGRIAGDSVYAYGESKPTSHYSTPYTLTADMADDGDNSKKKRVSRRYVERRL